MARLAERLEEFASALLDPERAVPEGLVGPDSEPSARRFAVYRNNVFVGLTDALRAGFPCVVKLVGDEYFAAMARVFAAAMPPGSPVLLHYGAEFPDFIASFPRRNPCLISPTWPASSAPRPRLTTSAKQSRWHPARSPAYRQTKHPCCGFGFTLPCAWCARHSQPSRSGG